MSDSSQQPGRRPPQAGAGRGIALVVFATLIGVLLLWRAPMRDARDLTDSSSARTTIKKSGTTPKATPTSTTAAPPVTQLPPGQLTITVANGSGKGGAAKAMKTLLASKGYTGAKATNPAGNAGVPATVIYFDAGYEADAKAVATAAGLAATIVRPRPATVPLDAADQAAKVLVLLGADYTPPG